MFFLFDADVFFIYPFFAPCSKDDDAVLVGVNDVFDSLFDFFKLSFREFTFENAVLYPVEVLAEIFAGFVESFDADVVGEDDIHFLK